MRDAVKPNRSDEGAALVLALCLTLVASVIGASLMMLSQTETYASVNYRSMTQARYGAESGVHKAINYLLNTYPAPGPASATDPLTAYDITKSPVLYGGNPVILSATPGVASNYPVGTTIAAFLAAVQGSLSTGGTSEGYTAIATLLSMKPMTGYGTGVSTVVQTWEITGTGTTAGARPATVEVTAVLEQQVVAFNMYGLFATNPSCGALSFGGGVTTDSYDSSSMTISGGVPVTQPLSGDVGTNGNLTEGGGSIVNGTLSTPRSGVGHCSSGAVDALTQNGNSQVTGGLIQLPQAVVYPPPALPNPLPPTTAYGINSNLTLAPGWYGDVAITGGSTVHLTAGTYNLNSIRLVGNSTIIIDSGPVILNVVGTGKTNPIDLGGGSVSNPTFLPKNLQIQYAGTGGVQINGGASTALMVYAPLASVSLTGGSGIYGSVLGATIQDTGGTAIHYDRDLPTEFFTSWNAMLSSFSWKKS